ncbi:MAG: alpha/beta hydrolase [Candidatus Rokuibacteriota bacterium]
MPFVRPLLPGGLDREPGGESRRSSSLVRRPPIVFVHGAANSGRVWQLWQRDVAARGWPSYALDLRSHGDSPAGDLAATSMADYADDVERVVRQLGAAPVLVGWSMGGLTALMAAARGGVAAWVGLGPSPPARARDESIPLRTGVFGPEEYGITSRDVADQPTMPDLDAAERAIALASLDLESRYARDERKAGVVVGNLECPALVVAGTADQSFPPATYRDLPFTADLIEAPGASHWGLVLGGRTLQTLVPAVLAWLDKHLPAPRRDWNV